MNMKNEQNNFCTSSFLLCTHMMRRSHDRHKLELLKLIDKGGVDGCVLVANQNLEAGQVILDEEPLMIFPSVQLSFDQKEIPPIPSSVTRVPLTPDMCGVGAPRWWVNYWVFQSLSLAVKEQVLQFYIPSESNQSISVYLRTIAECCETVDRELFVKVNLVYATNSVCVSEVGDDAAALYLFACRITHSCKPNSIWRSKSDGRRFVKTVAPVLKGDEITIGYLEQELHAKPIVVRRAALQKNKFFWCLCTRCCAFGDDTRRFSCCTKDCTGSVLVHQPSVLDVPSFVTCKVCDKVAPESCLQTALVWEKNIVRELAEINHIVNLGDGTPQTIDRIIALHALHPHHYLAYEICYLQWEAYSQIVDLRMVVRALEAQIECLETILGFPNYSLIDRYSRLGDALVEISQDQCFLVKAYNAYNQACQYQDLIGLVLQDCEKFSKRRDLTQSRIMNHMLCVDCKQFRNQCSKRSVLQLPVKYAFGIFFIGCVLLGFWTDQRRLWKSYF
jgi:hypothetical protein